MNLAEKLLAGITFAVCVVLLVRLGLGDARRHRFDSVIRTLGGTIRRTTQQLWRRPASRRAAAREANAAIERARTGRARDEADDGEWKGNVYTPKSFRKPRKPH